MGATVFVMAVLGLSVGACVLIFQRNEREETEENEAVAETKDVEGNDSSNSDHVSSGTDSSHVCSFRECLCMMCNLKEFKKIFRKRTRYLRYRAKQEAKKFMRKRHLVLAKNRRWYDCRDS